MAAGRMTAEFCPKEVIISVAAALYTFIMTMVIMNTGRLKKEASRELSRLRSTAVPRHPSTTASMRPLVRPSRTPTSALTSILEPSERSNDPQEKMKVAPVATSATSDALATTTSKPMRRSKPRTVAQRRYSPANAAQAPAGIQRVRSRTRRSRRRRASRSIPAGIAAAGFSMYLPPFSDHTADNIPVGQLRGAGELACQPSVPKDQ